MNDEDAANALEAAKQMKLLIGTQNKTRK